MEYAISDGTQTTSLVLDSSLTRAQIEEEDPLRPMVDTANLLGFTLYPIDVPGFDRIDNIGTGAATDSAYLTAQKEPTDLQELQRERELFVHDSLDALAFGTGGEAMVNAQRLGALPAARADTRDYYWLGFSRNREDDDERHSIEIEVLRPGLRVRSRNDYLDLSPETEADLFMEGALLFDNTLDTGPLQLSLGEPLDPRKKRLEVPLNVRIPLDEIAMIATEGFYAGELEVRISVMDHNGNSASSEVRGVAPEGDETPGSGAFYTYSTTLEIRNRNHKIVVGVKDLLSGSFLAGTVRMDP